jgi:hypothetical protein
MTHTCESFTWTAKGLRPRFRQGTVGIIQPKISRTFGFCWRKLLGNPATICLVVGLAIISKS